MWHPSEEIAENSQMATFIKQVNNDYGLQIENYFQLYKWSIEKTEAFWETSEIIGNNLSMMETISTCQEQSEIIGKL